MSSTAVGEGIAIPHAKSEAVKSPSMAAMTVPNGVDYEAMDDEPSNLLFMIAAPNDGDVPSGFLGALFAGFAGGFLMLGIEKLCDKMPQSLNGIKPVLIYPLAGLGLIAVIMCDVNPFMGMLNTGLSDLLSSMGDSSKIVLGCILGGMMAIDMGGPFNKAAYVFGTAAIASGNYDIMAPVMIGGMVPPIAIALATTFFKNRWTEEERAVL